MNYRASTSNILQPNNSTSGCGPRIWSENKLAPVTAVELCLVQLHRFQYFALIWPEYLIFIPYKVSL